ncbi:MAG: cell surface protein SprA, partial [Candidatus Neomarinimicrobiota bacterium]
MKNSRLAVCTSFLIFIGLSALWSQPANPVRVQAIRLNVQSRFVVDPFPALPVAIGLLGDTLIHARGLVALPFKKTEKQATITPDWSTITITEVSDGQTYKMPLTAPLDWYFNAMLERQGMISFKAAMRGQAKTPAADSGTRRSGKSLELVGVDVGELGRVALRVRGNVNISGKMVFQDQQLNYANYNESQNTHIEFDQKQNLNIEGKIGDRITILMDQDSERDFDWENNIRITYDGQEDEIIQKVEAGNISLSLPSTQYVTFSGKNQGLFGLKAISKLGPVDITTIASIEQTRKEKQKFSGSNTAQTQRIPDYQYRKDQYFFIHEWFRNGVDTTIAVSGQSLHGVIFPFYPLSADGKHYQGNLIVKDFELFKSRSGGVSVAGEKTGIAYVNPDQVDSYSDWTENQVFVRMERDNDYYINEDFGYLRIRTPINNEVLGCIFKLVVAGTGDTLKIIGSASAADDTLKMQLLRPQAPTPQHPSWDLMFKNVYYLGTSNINTEGFAVRIINDQVTPASEWDGAGTAYLTHFGLDLNDDVNSGKPDQKIDYTNPNIVNLANGEILFPTFHPFIAAADSLGGGSSAAALAELLGEGIMYTSTDQDKLRRDSRFTIEADYTNLASNISLGFMVVEGSEEVKLDGVTLIRGTDYQIDYFGGTLIFLNEAAMAPGANLEVMYEKHELVSFDKKTIIGTRAQMDFGENSFIGVTALYYNQSVLNEKIEVGYEPTRNFIWDFNGRFNTDLEGVTRLLDRLPFLETEKMTSVAIEGEFAQVLPNPNPINNPATGDDNGVAYIDDFEGAKRTTTPQVQQRYWRSSSAPLDPESGEQLPQSNRAQLYWYNPYYPVATTDIWPNQSVSRQAQNETTHILALNMSHQKHQSQVPDDSIWAGIVSPFFSGDYDQTRSKFFEIWLRGTEGRLTVDLGRISEDWNGNNKLDTEDRPEAGFSLGNGQLDKGEDVGLDGCGDEYEDGWGGCLDPNGLTYAEYYDLGDMVHINRNGLRPDDRNYNPVDDPNGDNYKKYQGGDPRYVNGTEGNSEFEGGFYPDTEDIDGSGFLDRTNDYFTKSFSLDKNADDAEYVAGETIKDGTLTGWRLYRIPLNHFTKIKPDGSIDWNDIRNIRLSLTGVDSVAGLQVAKIELVGNEWKELGISIADTAEYAIDDSVFAITIINTEDNPGYTPPKGVKGEYDRINEIRAKEQSLVLKFDDLPGGARGAAEKTLMTLTGERAQSYLTYDRMKMFVYGDCPGAVGLDETDLEFFLQFGKGNYYYEVSQPVYEGWDETRKRNAVDLDLEWLTGLKLADSTTVKKINADDVFRDSADVKEYHFSDNDGVLTGRRIRIKGTPALSQIQYMRVGVRNVSALPLSGEVWIDELRLSGVRKDRGVAMRVQGKIDLADIASTTVAYSRKDADFHVLQQRLGSASSSEDFRINASLKLDKFLPKAWGLKVPVSTSFSNTVSRPKYHPGSDILLNQDNIPDSLLTLSNSINLTTSIAKSTRSDNRLIKYTVDQISTSFTAKQSTASNYQTARNWSEAYTGKISYSLPFGSNNYVAPLKWLKPLPLLGNKLSDLHLYYTPTNISTNLNVSETYTEKEPRAGTKTTTDYSLGMTRA